jgi:hypothetical protein
MHELDNMAKLRSSVPKWMTTIVLLLLFIFYLTACGKKGSPVPPRIIIPPPVNNLNKMITGKMLKLTWLAPASPENVQAAIAGFIVYRSKQPTSKPPCEKCPVLFDRMADIPADTKSPGNLFEYIETLETGFSYIYKVTIYTRSRTPGNDSNFIRFRL